MEGWKEVGRSSSFSSRGYARARAGINVLLEIIIHSFPFNDTHENYSQHYSAKRSRGGRGEGVAKAEGGDCIILIISSKPPSGLPSLRLAGASLLNDLHDARRPDGVNIFARAQTRLSDIAQIRRIHKRCQEKRIPTAETRDSSRARAGIRAQTRPSRVINTRHAHSV